MNPPPVLLMTYSLVNGGSERQACEMAIELTHRGWTVHFASMRAEGPFLDVLQKANIPLAHFPASSFTSASYPGQVWRLRSYLRRHGIRLAHAFDPPARLMVVPAARLAGLPAILTSHRGSIQFYEQDRKMLRAIRLMDSWAHAVVANCKAMEAELLESEGIPASKIHLNYNGIDPQRYQPGEPSIRPSYLRPEHFVIGAISVMRPEKDFITLINAFAEVHRDAPHTRLVLVGNGVDRERLQGRITELGLDSVAFLEPPTRDVQGWLRCLSVFVLPSLTEAFSNSLMEAMSAARVCVASRIGGNPELIEHGKTGLLFEAGNPVDLANQLRAILADPAQAQTLAAAARTRIVNDFSMQAATTRLEGIYRKHLGLTPSPNRP